MKLETEERKKNVLRKTSDRNVRSPNVETFLRMILVFMCISVVFFSHRIKMTSTVPLYFARNATNLMFNQSEKFQVGKKN